MIGILPYEPLGPDELEPAEPRMGQIENRWLQKVQEQTYLLNFQLCKNVYTGLVAPPRWCR